MVCYCQLVNGKVPGGRDFPLISIKGKALLSQGSSKYQDDSSLFLIAFCC